MVEKISDLAPPKGFKRWLFRSPLAFYRFGLGWLLGSRFVLLEHIGRISGKARQVVLEVVSSTPSEGAYFVVSAWGEKADWYQNIRANPQVAYQVGRRRYIGIAQVLPAMRAEEVFVEYGRKHPRLLQGLMRFIGYQIEAKESDYRALAKHLPVVKLAPAQRKGC